MNSPEVGLLTGRKVETSYTKLGFPGIRGFPLCGNSNELAQARDGFSCYSTEQEKRFSAIHYSTAVEGLAETSVRTP